MSTTTGNSHQRIRDFLESNPVAALATADVHGIPYASTIYFVVDKDFNFFFVTKQETQKYKNLTDNKHAALTIHDTENQTTVQVTGSVKLINDINRFMDIYDQILTISSGVSSSDRPPVSKLFAGDYVLFCLVPNSVRLAEYSNPDHGEMKIFEAISQNS